MRSLISVVALTAGLLAGTELRAQAKFDGTWSVEVITEAGDCDRAYRYPVIIAGGRARYGGPEAFQVSGRVAANGAVSGRISRGSDAAVVKGRLDGQWGRGTWSTSGSRICSGRWVAEKRG